MRKWMLILAASLTLATAAQALYVNWGPWKPGQNISASFWPRGAEVLANRKERVGGHMLNSFDHFLYRGDLAALNAFLKDVEKVEGGRTVYFLGADQRIGFINPRQEGGDWSMSISANSHLAVFIAADGWRRLPDLKLPKDVQVEAVGEVDREVTLLVAEHEKQRAAAKKSE